MLKMYLELAYNLLYPFGNLEVTGDVCYALNGCRVVLPK